MLHTYRTLIQASLFACGSLACSTLSIHGQSIIIGVVDSARVCVRVRSRARCSWHVCRCVVCVAARVFVRACLSARVTSGQASTWLPLGTDRANNSSSHTHNHINWPTNHTETHRHALRAHIEKLHLLTSTPSRASMSYADVDGSAPSDATWGKAGLTSNMTTVAGEEARHDGFGGCRTRQRRFA